MSRINQLLNGIKSQIDAALPELKHCDIHGGRFNEKELSRITARSPAIFIANLGAQPVTATGDGRQCAVLTLAAFVVTTNEPKLTSDEGANNIVEALLTIIPNNRWGCEYAGDSEKLNARNLYGGELSRGNAAIWALGWQQTVVLGDILQEAGVLPSELYLGLDPEIGPAHKDKYIKVDGLPDGL